MICFFHHSSPRGNIGTSLPPSLTLIYQRRACLGAGLVALLEFVAQMPVQHPHCLPGCVAGALIRASVVSRRCAQSRLAARMSMWQPRSRFFGLQCLDPHLAISMPLPAEPCGMWHWRGQSDACGEKTHENVSAMKRAVRKARYSLCPAFSGAWPAALPSSSRMTDCSTRNSSTGIWQRIR